MQETAQQYIQRILGHVEGQDPMRVQRETPKKLARLVKPLSKKQLMARPEPGKWSIAEVLAHLADTEVAGGWRMRLILGNNGVPVQAFDQDAWAETLGYSRYGAQGGAREQTRMRCVLRAGFQPVAPHPSPAVSRARPRRLRCLSGWRSTGCRVWRRARRTPRR